MLHIFIYKKTAISYLLFAVYILFLIRFSSILVEFGF